MNRSARMATTRAETGGDQGRTGPNAEGCRALTEAICRDLWRDYWPLLAMVAMGLLMGAYL